jgi:hypothetical protein
VFGDDSPSPRAVVGRILGLATTGGVVTLLVMLVSTGHIAWTVLAFVGLLWALWGFLSGLFGALIEPAGRFLANQVTGNVAMPDAVETLDEEAVRFERLLTQPLAAHQEILIGIRLAEIYRTHQHDAAKSDALLARLRAKHPEAPELAHGGTD